MPAWAIILILPAGVVAIVAAVLAGWVHPGTGVITAGGVVLSGLMRLTWTRP